MSLKDETPTGEEAQRFFYFGYGAMVNPRTRARRNVHSVSERAAILPDFRMAFQTAGAANVVPCKGEQVHGVLLELASLEDWERVQANEKGYEIRKSAVTPYGTNEGIEATFFFMEGAVDSESGKPQDRYLRVIATGMRHHGVDEAYVHKYVLSVPALPSRTSENFLQFPSEVPLEELPVVDKAHYEAVAKEKHLFLLGQRVIQTASLDSSNAMSKMVHSRLIGNDDAMWQLWTSLLEPNLPELDNASQLTGEHTRWAEDQLVDFFAQSKLEGKAVMRLK